jgi:hypothetical protein
MFFRSPTSARSAAAYVSAPRKDRFLVRAAQAAFALAAVLLTILHLDRRWAPVDPVSSMLSDYALCPGWWMWSGALVLTSAGSAALLPAMRRRAVLAGLPVPAAMAVWCVSLLAVAVFTKDPQGGAVTTIGKIHLYAAAVSCFSLPVVGWTLGRQHRVHSSWRRHATWSRRLALVTIPFYLPFIVPFFVNVVLGGHLPTVATGLVERLMLVLEIGLLVVLGIWTKAAEVPEVSGNESPKRSPHEVRKGLPVAGPPGRRPGSWFAKRQQVQQGGAGLGVNSPEFGGPTGVDGAANLAAAVTPCPHRADTEGAQASYWSWRRSQDMDGPSLRPAGCSHSSCRPSGVRSRYP